jgi:uncharacterized membrane protein YidH (DUF202 family)
MPSAPERPARPILAVERTQLAWSRSALAIVAVAGSLVKLGADGGHVALALGAAGLLIALAGAVWLIGLSAGHVDAARRRRSLRLITFASVASACVAFALVLAS